jgi:hypothetical protein
MKTIVIRSVLTILFLIAFGSTVVADGVPLPPFCPPGSTCN